MYKIIEETADKENRICKVVIQSKEGQFVGQSFCNETDNFSPFAGIRYAQKRAVAALCRHKAGLAKTQYNTIKNLKQDFVYNGLPVPRPVKIKLRDFFNDIEYWTNSAKILEQSVLLDDKERADILTRYGTTKQVK